MDFEENNDESDNFSTLLMTLQNYFSIKIPAKRLTPNSELLSFFNIQSIINKDSKSLLNLSKLLLCISSFCSNKTENLKKISILDLSLVQAYYDSVHLFIIKNSEKRAPTNNNNNKLNIFSSIFEEDNNLKEKEIEKLKKIIEEKDSIISQYKVNDLLKHDISVIQPEQDFLGMGEEMTIMNLDFEFNNSKNYKIEKNTSFSFEKINIKKIFMDSILIPQKSTNISNSSSQNYTISRFFLNFTGGDGSDKRIKSLENTINQYEAIIKDLKEKIESLSNKYNEEIAQIIKNQENEIQKIIHNKNINNYEEIMKFRNEKNMEIDNLRKLMNDKEKLTNQQIEDIRNQLNIEKDNRKRESELFNLDRVKMQNEYERKIKDLNNIINNYDNNLKIANYKLNSDPYFAKEIMSKTLYNFASKIMINKNKNNK